LSAFFDTNVLFYIIEPESRHSSAASNMVLAGGTTSVQVLNELTNAARRKLHLPWDEIRKWRSIFLQTCDVVPLTEAGQSKAMAIAERYQLHIYDASIWAAAILAGCETLYSEDMHAGRAIQGTTLRNPFLG
jgi:predicted nucleic acid-binding protein